MFFFFFHLCFGVTCPLCLCFYINHLIYTLRQMCISPRIVIHKVIQFIFLECIKACEKFLSHRWNALWYSVLKRLLAPIKNFKTRETCLKYSIYIMFGSHILEQVLDISGKEEQHSQPENVLPGWDGIDTYSTTLTTWKCGTWMKWYWYLIWRSYPNMYHYHGYWQNFVFLWRIG